MGLVLQDSLSDLNNKAEAAHNATHHVWGTGNFSVWAWNKKSLDFPFMIFILFCKRKNVWLNVKIKKKYSNFTYEQLKYCF